MGSLQPQPDTKSRFLRKNPSGVGKGNWDGERGWELEKGSREPVKDPPGWGKDPRDHEKTLWDGEKTLSGQGRGPRRLGKESQGPGKDPVEKEKTPVD